MMIGIGDLIGNEEDIIFSFDYEYIDFDLLYEPLQFLWRQKLLKHSQNQMEYVQNADIWWINQTKNG